MPLSPLAISHYSWTTTAAATLSVDRVLGDEIRKARIQAGLTQDQLAFKAKLSRNYISLLELNDKSPTIETLTRICSALNVKPSRLLARMGQ